MWVVQENIFLTHIPLQTNSVILYCASSLHEKPQTQPRGIIISGDET